ncbi:MAG: histidine phosphatase family protein [Candidatus Krumholzibacteria bacterium]|nr:histidine phosphatase family protein [Candidatus Krumholzibacteria bacterium]
MRTPWFAVILPGLLLAAAFPAASRIPGDTQSADSAAIHAASVAEAAPAPRTLYLIRHGFYDENDKRAPEVGKALLPLGVAQARLVANRLRSLPVHFSVIYSSTMTRARETALVIHRELDGVDMIESRLLAECTPPTWREDIMADCDQAELAACQEQLEEAFARFFVPASGEARHDILVCHGNVIRYFVTRVLDVDPMSWLKMSIGNCSLTVVRVNPDGTMKLLLFGDVGHVPPNLQTGLDSVERILVVPRN